MSSLFQLLFMYTMYQKSTSDSSLQPGTGGPTSVAKSNQETDYSSLLSVPCPLPPTLRCTLTPKTSDCFCLCSNLYNRNHTRYTFCVCPLSAFVRLIHTVCGCWLLSVTLRGSPCVRRHSRASPVHRRWCCSLTVWCAP